MRGLGICGAVAALLGYWPRAAEEQTPAPPRANAQKNFVAPRPGPAVAPLPLRIGDQSKDMVALLQMGDDVLRLPVARSLRWHPEEPLRRPTELVAERDARETLSKR